MIAVRNIFRDRAALAIGLARAIATTLESRIAAAGAAILAVSGGITPKAMFDRLSAEAIAWDKVTVTLVDERQVPITNDRSNARLVSQHLLINKAAAARFVPLYDNTAAAARIGRFDAVVLGMGDDGHTASFFPQGDNLAIALDRRIKERIVTMRAPDAPEPRLTFTLASLVESPFIALHIEGEEKMRVLERAEADGPVGDMPIRAVLRAPEPVALYWAP